MQHGHKSTPRPHLYIPDSLITHSYLAKPLPRDLGILSDVAAFATRFGHEAKCWVFLARDDDFYLPLFRCQGAVYRGCAIVMAQGAGRPSFQGADMHLA